MGGVGEGEAERDGAVEDEVQHNVEIAAEIGFSLYFGDATVKTVAEAACGDEKNGDPEVLKSNGDACGKAERATRQCD